MLYKIRVSREAVLYLDVYTGVCGLQGNALRTKLPQRDASTHDLQSSQLVTKYTIYWLTFPSCENENLVTERCWKMHLSFPVYVVFFVGYIYIYIYMYIYRKRLMLSTLLYRGLYYFLIAKTLLIYRHSWIDKQHYLKKT